MPRRTLTSWDFLGFSILNAMLHPVSADPAGLGAGDKGRVWFNSTSNKLMVWNGTTAIDFTARTNHTGTQTASTISDFLAAVQSIPWGSLANPTADVNAGGKKITNMADGTAGTDAATYGQLLAIANNQAFKAPVRAATTANITLSGTQTVDGVTLVVGDRVLVKDQTTASTNGIYVVASGAWARASDFDTNAEAVPGSIVGVQEGTANGDKMFLLATNGPITLGTTNLTFSAYGASTGEIGVAGNGLTKTGSTYDVGAGTGISVAADTVAIDTSVVARKIVGNVPATTGGIFSVSGANVTVNHGLGNSAPHVQVVVGATPPSGMTAGQPVEVDWSVTDANNVVLTFPAAPAAGNYTVCIIG